jgi:hypothetical protein
MIEIYLVTSGDNYKGIASASAGDNLFTYIK